MAAPLPPTTAALATDLRNQLAAALSQAIPLLPKSVLAVFAKILAGTYVLLWKYVGYLHLQMWARFASTSPISVNGIELIPLLEIARGLGLRDRLDANRAELDLTVTVTNQSGTLPVGSQLLRPSTGVVYVTTAPVDLDAPTVTVRVRASSDQQGDGGVGAQGNLSPGDIVSFASPLPNVSRDAVVLSQAVTAENAEDWEAYRRLVIERGYARPQGGAYADYRTWAREVPGIVAAYPYTGFPGEVDLYVEASEASSGDPDGIPTGAQLTAVANSCTYDEDGIPSRKPVGAALNVLPITRLSFVVTIAGLSAPDGTEDQIREALEAYYLEREPYIVGLNALPSRQDRVLLSTVIGIVDDVTNAVGGSVGTITVYLGGPETPSYTLGAGEKAKLGTLTFL